MQTVLSSEFKRGMVLLLDGAPQVIEDFHVSGTAQTKHKLHVRLRNLRLGRVSERQFSDAERVPVADMEYRTVTFSYAQGDRCVFLDTRTYEEFSLGADQVGERRFFFKEDVECRALLLEGRLLDIVPPMHVALEIVETAPAIRGGSDATWKPARLETGLEIMVPLFLEKGDRVRVDTATRKYAGKDSGG